jgi:NAD(P)H-nitrite reductase large subunit
MRLPSTRAPRWVGTCATFEPVREDTHCKFGKQDALKIAMKLDQTDYGWALPGKFKMAVSGCHLRCPEY